MGWVCACMRDCGYVRMSMEMCWQASLPVSMCLSVCSCVCACLAIIHATIWKFSRNIATSNNNYYSNVSALRLSIL